MSPRDNGGLRLIVCSEIDEREHGAALTILVEALTLCLGGE